MKTIKYNYCGFSPSYSNEDIYNLFLKPLENKYNFILDENPDYIICSRIANIFDFSNYKGIRILYNGENTQPDFHSYDYVISFDYGLSFKDRFCYFYHCANFLDNLEVPTLTKDQAFEVLKTKTRFCSFSNSHDRVDMARKHYLDLLDSYKRVDVIGSLYYRGGPLITDWNEKLSFLNTTKFTLVIESSVFSGGLITEKIFHALQANTIPIYLGEKEVKDIINPKRIININDFDSDQKLLDKVIEIDNDDNLFVDIISQPSLFNPNLLLDMKGNLITFLDNIFSQDYSKAFRRPNVEYDRNVRLDTCYRIAKDYYSSARRPINRILGKFFKKRIVHKI